MLLVFGQVQTMGGTTGDKRAEGNEKSGCFSPLSASDGISSKKCIFKVLRENNSLKFCTQQKYP